MVAANLEKRLLITATLLQSEYLGVSRALEAGRDTPTVLLQMLQDHLQPSVK